MCEDQRTTTVVIPLCHVGPRNGNQVVSLGRVCHHPPNYVFMCVFVCVFFFFCGADGIKELQALLLGLQGFDGQT